MHILASLFINIQLCKMYIDRTFCFRAKLIFTCKKHSSVRLQNGEEPEKTQTSQETQSNKNITYQAFQYISLERIRVGLCLLKAGCEGEEKKRDLTTNVRHFSSVFFTT